MSEVKLRKGKDLTCKVDKVKIGNTVHYIGNEVSHLDNEQLENYKNRQKNIYYKSDSLKDLMTRTRYSVCSNDDLPENPENKKYLEELNSENYQIFESQTRFLLGKILTIVDASFPDKDQRKAVKDLVKQQFYDQQKWVYEICTGNRMLCATGESSTQDNYSHRSVED